MGDLSLISAILLLLKDIISTVGITAAGRHTRMRYCKRIGTHHTERRSVEMAASLSKHTVHSERRLRGATVLPRDGG